MRNALRRAAGVKMAVVQHAEDTNVTVGCSMNYGATSFRLGVHGMPNSAESAWWNATSSLARETKGPRACRASLDTRGAGSGAPRKESEAARNRGSHTSPFHADRRERRRVRHQLQDESATTSAADRDALIAGILDGTIDAIATDHAPHAFHEKQVEFERAAFGIAGLETALPIVLTVLHHHFKLPLWRIVELLATNPAKNLQPDWTRYRL